MTAAHLFRVDLSKAADFFHDGGLSVLLERALGKTPSDSTALIIHQNTSHLT